MNRPTRLAVALCLGLCLGGLLAACNADRESAAPPATAPPTTLPAPQAVAPLSGSEASELGGHDPYPAPPQSGGSPGLERTMVLDLEALDRAPIASRAAYAELEIGMSLQEVVGVLGAAGAALIRYSTQQHENAMYAWRLEDEPDNAIALQIMERELSDKSIQSVASLHSMLAATEQASFGNLDAFRLSEEESAALITSLEDIPRVPRETAEALPRVSTYEEAAAALGTEGRELMRMQMVDGESSSFVWPIEGQEDSVLHLRFTAGEPASQEMQSVSSLRSLVYEDPLSPSAGSAPVTLDGYRRLQMGMSYEEAVAILASEGMQTFQREGLGHPSAGFVWRGEAPGSTLRASFVENDLGAKAQLGLR